MSEEHEIRGMKEMTEGVLSRRFGGEVRLDEGADLGGSNRSYTYRYVVVDGPDGRPTSVAVKKARGWGGKDQGEIHTHDGDVQGTGRPRTGVRGFVDIPRRAWAVAVSASPWMVTRMGWCVHAMDGALVGGVPACPW